MCNTRTPQEPADVPQPQTFDNYPDFLAAIKPGFRLCTSDFTGWANVTAVTESSVIATTDEQVEVEVPQEALLDIRGGHCVRLDRVKATIDKQGWERSTVNS